MKVADFQRLVEQVGLLTGEQREALAQVLAGQGEAGQTTALIEARFADKATCPHCQGEGQKWGFAAGLRRYRCRACKKSFNALTKTPLAFLKKRDKLAESWIFPPALTLQYHFDNMGGFKPYIGIGAQYIHFFSSGTGDNTLNATGVKFSDAFGLTFQAGVDIKLGGGWYLNADVKKSWLETKATWTNSAITGGNILAKTDLDPLIVSVGVGYRFNLEDLFGQRHVDALK